MLLCSAVRSCRGDRLPVRSHHIGDPADLRVAPQLVRARAPFLPTVAQGFHGHVDADLVTVLETIRYLYPGVYIFPREELIEWMALQKPSISAERTGETPLKEVD